MIEGSITKYFYDLDKFVRKVKEKCWLRKDKHPNTEINTTENLKEHLIDEILELFKLENDGYINDYNTVRNILLLREIDYNKCVDVAAMCWTINLSVRNDIKTFKLGSLI